MKFGAINMEQFLGNFLRSMPGDALTQQWSHTIPLHKLSATHNSVVRGSVSNVTRFVSG